MNRITVAKERNCENVVCQSPERPKSILMIKKRVPSYSYNPCKSRAVRKAKGRLCGTSCIRPSAYKCSICPECTLHCPNFIENVGTVKKNHLMSAMDTDSFLN